MQPTLSRPVYWKLVWYYPLITRKIITVKVIKFWCLLKQHVSTPLGHLQAQYMSKHLKAYWLNKHQNLVMLMVIIFMALNTFIVPIDAHYYKIIEMLKQF